MISVNSVIDLKTLNPNPKSISSISKSVHHKRVKR